MDDIFKIQNAKPAIPRIAFVYKLSIKEPLGIAYLSAYLKQQFPGIIIGFFDPKVDSLQSLRDFSPTIILYSLMSGQYRETVDRNRYLKSMLAPFVSVFGGPHPTYFPEMIHDDGVDIICRGEGERSLAHLVERLIRGEAFTDIKGLWVKLGDKVFENEIGDLIENLDELPFPDRELFYSKSPLFKGRIAKSIFSARGCPFKCSYCYNSSLNALVEGKGSVLRHRSPDSVIKEVRQLKARYPLPYLMFGEDVFSGMKLEWLQEFAKDYSPLGIPYNIGLRAEFVTPSIVDLLKKSGCASVALAIEHGDFEYRKKYLHRNMTNERLLDSIEMLEKSGIRVASPTMIGLPFTEYKDDIGTLELVCKAKPTYAGVTIFQPYPGLPLTNVCLEKKLINPSYVENLNVDCYQAASIKGIDYAKVTKLRKTFGIVRVLGYRFPDKVSKIAEWIPDNFFFRHFNNLLNFYYFNKIYDYKRGVLMNLRELYVGLDTGAFGTSLKWFTRREKF